MTGRWPSGRETGHLSCLTRSSCSSSRRSSTILTKGIPAANGSSHCGIFISSRIRHKLPNPHNRVWLEQACVNHYISSWTELYCPKRWPDMRRGCCCQQQVENRLCLHCAAGDHRMTKYPFLLLILIIFFSATLHVSDHSHVLSQSLVSVHAFFQFCGSTTQ